MKEVTVIQYESEDGELFETIEECRVHEAQQAFMESYDRLFSHHQLYSDGTADAETVMAWILDNRVPVEKLLEETK